PGIDYRAIAANLAVPHPGFRVDRLADGAEQAQGREVILPGPDFAKPHHRAERRWRGVEDRHVVALDQAPDASRVGEVRRALVDDTRRADDQRAVDDVGMSGDP